ncbi:putative ATPase of the ABC class [Corynebacterium confusum]|nr:putative ATPase of the ABC class [Corynebacterium confusum]
MAGMSGRNFRGDCRSGGTLEDLAKACHGIDGAGYGAYKKLAGTYTEPGPDGLTVAIDKVQSDPFAAPSKVRVRVPRAVADLPADVVTDELDKVAVADFLARRIARIAAAIGGGKGGKGRKGSGKSNSVSVGFIGQEVLERSAVVVTDEVIEVRLLVGLPAQGRRVLGHRAAGLLAEDLPDAVEEAVVTEEFDPDDLARHVWLLRDQEALRAQLATRDLVGFVGNGAILPRRAGDSNKPMDADTAAAFIAPEELTHSFELPSGRTVTGMGVPAGLTVIVGGGYHGKSTLLRALERGVYPHVAGDGREWVITRADAVSVRAEDGRPVTDLDISPFITNLPTGADTRRFSTTNASGSTSQAANVVEAAEAGATALLIDEDTSATNFMIRDRLMQELVPGDQEPITPYVARVKALYQDKGISTVLIAGGSGAYLSLADTVIAMDRYQPHEITSRAHEIAAGSRPHELELAPGMFEPSGRALAPGCLKPAAGHKGKPQGAKPRGLDTISFAKSDIDLSAVSQLADAPQTAAIALCLEWLGKHNDSRPVTELVDELLATITAESLTALTPGRAHPGHLSRPRKHEILAAVNRYRRLDIKR